MFEITWTVWVGAVALGLAFFGVAVGIWISYRVLNFPDLTVDGSFPLGAAVSAALIVRGVDPWLSLGPALLAGALAGLTTGWLTTRVRINGLLAGILVSIGLYSINLRVMDNRANVPLLNVPTMLEGIRGAVRGLGLRPIDQFGGVPNWSAVLLFGALALVACLLLTWFLNTELGLAVRAAGDNERMVRAQALDADDLKVLGLAISNALVALSGAFVAQYQGFADAGMGLGTIVAGLASVIVGDTLLRPAHVPVALAGAVLGSIIYRLAIAGALVLGLAATDTRLVTALIVIVALSVPGIRRSILPRAGSVSTRPREAVRT